MKTLEEQVIEFMDTFECPRDPELWKTMVLEEVTEVREAAVHLLKELCDVAYTCIGLAEVTGGGEEAYKLVKEDPAFDFMNSGLFENILGLFPESVLAEAFRRVHQSNMSKVLPDGTIMRREDGKIIKPDTYQPPKLDDLLP